MGTDRKTQETIQSFCTHTMLGQKTLIVEDAKMDDRFKNFDIVTGAPGVRSYAGVPLVTPLGTIIGTLCVFDLKVRSFSKVQISTLERLSKTIMHFLEMRVVILNEKQIVQKDHEKQKEFLNAVLESLSDGVIACDMNGEIHRFNEGSRRFHGTQDSVHISPQAWAENYDLYRTDGKTLLTNEEIPLYRAFKGEVVKDYEMVAITPEGERRLLRVNGRSFSDKEGKKIGAVITISDITEVRNAVSRENATSMTLKTLIDLAPVGITILDSENRITTWNKSAEHMTEWTEAEVLGKSIYEALSDNKSNSERIHTQVHQNAENFSAEMEYSTKNGNKVDIKISVVPIYDGEGKQSGSMGVSVNISDLRERERKLLEANRVLKEVSVAKSDFLANMSHEIRTPLNGVIAMSEILGMTSLSNDQRDMLKTVQSSADNLLTILSDILDFSKIEAGKLEIESISFDVNDLIKQALRSLQPIANSKNLLLSISLPSMAQTSFKGDPGRIRQVLLNLVSNALKFTEKGEISTALFLTPIKNGQTTLRLEVLDTGIGMSKAQVEKLFHAFSQADASTTRRFGGTGLGLSISQRLVQLMNGEIGVESVEGQGSKFWFTLPLEVAEVAIDTPKEFSEITTLQPLLTGHHILIAEDNRVNQKIAKAMVEKLGATCEVVENGQDAIGALQEKEFSLVLMDCQMPVMDDYLTKPLQIGNLEILSRYLKAG